MWTVIEPGIYLIAATLPSLRTLFNPFIKRLGVSTLRKRFPLTNQSGPDKFRDSAKGTTLVSHSSRCPQELATHNSVSRPNTVVFGATPHRESIKCFSRLDGPWQPEILDDRPQSSASCYRSKSVRYSFPNGGEDNGSLDDLPELERNPFVIRVQKTTSLSIEPRALKGVTEVV